MSRYNNIKDVIKNEIKKNGNLKKELISVHWEDIVGKPLAKKSYIEKIKYRILFVVVENSVWMQQMQFYKKNIIDSVNEFLNGKYVKDIKFKIGERKNIENIDFDFKKINKIKTEDIILDSEQIYNIKKNIENINTDLKPNIYKLMSLGKKREKVLLENGKKRCVKCGDIYSEDLEECPLCKISHINKIEKKALHEIEKRPEISFLDLKSFIPEIEKKTYIISKNKTKDKILKKIKHFHDMEKNDEMTKAIYDYFKLETGIGNKELLLKKVLFFKENFFKK